MCKHPEVFQNERFCHFFQIKETKHHFLFECADYNVHRNEYIPNDIRKAIRKPANDYNCYKTNELTEKLNTIKVKREKSSKKN